MSDQDIQDHKPEEELLQRGFAQDVVTVGLGAGVTGFVGTVAHHAAKDAYEKVKDALTPEKAEESPIIISGTKSDDE